MKSLLDCRNALGRQSHVHLAFIERPVLQDWLQLRGIASVKVSSTSTRYL
jgi:hypothetical protein